MPVILKENGQSELGECHSSLLRVCSASANLVLTDDSLMLEPRIEPSESLRASLRVLAEKPASPSKETCYQQLCKNSVSGNSVSFLVPVQRGPLKVRGQVLLDDIIAGVVDAEIAAEAARQLSLPLGPCKPSQAWNLFVRRNAPNTRQRPF